MKKSTRRRTLQSPKKREAKGRRYEVVSTREKGQSSIYGQRKGGVQEKEGGGEEGEKGRVGGTEEEGNKMDSVG